jgi:hypothetical protein
MRVTLGGALAGYWVDAEPFTVAEGLTFHRLPLREQRQAVAAHIVRGMLPCSLSATGLRSLTLPQFHVLRDAVVYGEDVDYHALHDAMEGEGEPPMAWYAARLCEEGLASSLVDALGQPYPLAQQALLMRQYARAKQAVESAKQQSDLPDTPKVREVQRVLIERAAARRRLRAG